MIDKKLQKKNSASFRKCINLGGVKHWQNVSFSFLLQLKKKKNKVKIRLDEKIKPWHCFHRAPEMLSLKIVSLFSVK